MSVPTAKEFYYNNKSDFEISVLSIPGLCEVMIEFAKLHLEAALEAASDTDILSGRSYKHRTNLDMDAILNAYPLDKIK